MNNPSVQFISDSMIPFILGPDNTLNSDVDDVQYDEEWEDGTIIVEEEIIEEDIEIEIPEEEKEAPEAAASNNATEKSNYRWCNMKKKGRNMVLNTDFTDDIVNNAEELIASIS